MVEALTTKTDAVANVVRIPAAKSKSIFKLPQTAELNLCGFVSAKIVSHLEWTNTYKDDLYDMGSWRFYVEASLGDFTGMFNFWCQNLD